MKKQIVIPLIVNPQKAGHGSVSSHFHCRMVNNKDRDQFPRGQIDFAGFLEDAREMIVNGYIGAHPGTISERSGNERERGDPHVVCISEPPILAKLLNDRNTVGLASKSKTGFQLRLNLTVLIWTEEAKEEK